MLAELSSKGQLVIPKSVRRSLGLKPGALFRVEVVEDKITLDPVVVVSPIEAPYKIHRRISYADAFAAALAISQEAILLTGNPELIQIADQIRVEKLDRVPSGRSSRNAARLRG